MEGWMEGWMMDGWMGRWMMDGRKDGWMDGRTNEQITKQQKKSIMTFTVGVFVQPVMHVSCSCLSRDSDTSRAAHSLWGQ